MNSAFHCDDVWLCHGWSFWFLFMLARQQYHAMIASSLSWQTLNWGLITYVPTQPQCYCSVLRSPKFLCGIFICPCLNKLLWYCSVLGDLPFSLVNLLAQRPHVNCGKLGSNKFCILNKKVDMLDSCLVFSLLVYFLSKTIFTIRAYHLNISNRSTT